VNTSTNWNTGLSAPTQLTGQLTRCDRSGPGAEWLCSRELTAGQILAVAIVVVRIAQPVISATR
jgi:hypothetical protein